MANEASPPRIVIVPSPGMGHLIPLVEFAKRVVSSHGLTATFAIPTDGPLSEAQKGFLKALPRGIDLVVLPHAELDDLPPDVKIETKISLTVARSLEQLRDTIKSLKATTRLVAMVVDLFGTDAFEIAKEVNISPYIFYPSTAMALSLFFYLPTLDHSTPSEYRDLPDPVQIPGCIPILGSDLIDPTQDRKNDSYKWLLHHAKRYTLAEGIMVNSFKELEPGAIGALQEEGLLGNPPVYPVGPLVGMGHANGMVDRSGCLEWLDGQPHGSVLFISFGSGGTLSSGQITELALGLELSEQKFLWIVRSPSDKTSTAAFFNPSTENDPLAYLPKGFVERTKGVGLVFPSWAPQARILSHGSTGGFLTHCGWNSTLESVVNGVPLIAWPLYAEQKMNAAMLTEDVKVALRPKYSKNGLVERTEIATIVRSLMEGEGGKQLRNRMRDLKDASAKTLSTDGESTRILTELSRKWKNRTSG
uniref:Glycosyltransferase n=1 Tax=Cyclamen persicum TaxID=87530 RepID=A7M6J9_9ERIC|nr:glucosyltransferase [Cyclamen persicum]